MYDDKYSSITFYVPYSLFFSLALALIFGLLHFGLWSLRFYIFIAYAFTSSFLSIFILATLNLLRIFYVCFRIPFFFHYACLEARKKKKRLTVLRDKGGARDSGYNTFFLLWYKYFIRVITSCRTRQL